MYSRISIIDVEESVMSFGSILYKESLKGLPLAAGFLAYALIFNHGLWIATVTFCLIYPLAASTFRIIIEKRRHSAGA